MSDGFAAWYEWAPGQGFGGSWRLYAYDGARQSVQLVDRAFPPGSKPVQPLAGDQPPALVGNKLFWTKVVTRGSGLEIRMYACSLPQCAPKQVDRGAAYPSASDGKVHWARSTAYLGNYKQRVYHAVEFDPEVGRSKVIASFRVPSGSVFDGLGSSGTHVAWTERTSSGQSIVHVLDTRTHETVTIRGQEGVGFNAPIVTDQLILVPDANGGSAAGVDGYLYRFSDHRLYTVGNESGLSTMSADSNCVSWGQKTGGSPANPKISWMTGCLPT